MKRTPRGQRYQLMEAAASRHKISARRVRDIVACTNFLDELVLQQPHLHAILGHRGITDVVRVLDSWRRQGPLRPPPAEPLSACEKYVSTVLETARKTRNIGLSRKLPPTAETDFAAYLSSTHLTWMETDLFEPWRTPSTGGLYQASKFGLGIYPPIEKLINITWQKPEGVWRYRKLQELGHALSSHPERQGRPIVGIQFVKSPSLTHLRERAIGIFLGAMGAAKLLEQVVLILPNESCFKNAIQMCEKAGFKNGEYGVWWMYPIGDIKMPKTA